MKKYLKILLPIVFLGALALGFVLFFAGKKDNNASQVQTSKTSNSVLASLHSLAHTLGSLATPVDSPPSSPTPENPASVSGDAVNTAPGASGTAFTFAVIGDTKVFSANNPNGNLQKAVTSIVKSNVSFSFVMGDLIHSCDGGSKCEASFAGWKSVMQPLLDKTYEIMGNHDRTGGSSADAVWQKEFNLPTNGPSGFSELTYSFDYSNSHFVVLDTEKPKGQVVDSAQRDWLEKDLSTNKKENVFVFFHEPAYQTAQNKDDSLDANPKERDALWTILVKHNVTAVFNGHEHIFSRKKVGNIYQFVVGDTDSTDDDFPQKNLIDYGYKGKSFAVVAIDGKKINMKLYTVDGNLINSFDF
jgi:hypothetical protein